MVTIEELLNYKSKYEKEKIFIEAKIAVVDEMITAEKAKENEVATETPTEKQEVMI